MFLRRQPTPPIIVYVVSPLEYSQDSPIEALKSPTFFETSCNCFDPVNGKSRVFFNLKEAEDLLRKTSSSSGIFEIEVSDKNFIKEKKGKIRERELDFGTISPHQITKVKFSKDSLIKKTYHIDSVCNPLNQKKQTDNLQQPGEPPPLKSPPSPLNSF